MTGSIYITGEIGVDVTLLDIIKQVKAQPEAQSFIVKIDSIGGFVDVGDDIFNYLINLPQSVTTYATKAYSIASKIFLAGSTRILPENAEQVIMVHLPWMQIAGSHEAITARLSYLKSVEDGLVKFYSETLQIDKNTIQSLLSKETYLDSIQAIELGFATMLQPMQKAVAKINNKEIEQDNLMNKFSKQLEAIYNKILGNPTIKNALILQDATGLEITFPDLDRTDVASEGDVATVDGKPAEGEFLLGDGQTLVFEAGAVKEIKPVKETPEEEPAEEVLDAETADKDLMISNLEAKVTELETKIADMLQEDDVDKLLNTLNASLEKQEEMEAKYIALAKQIGSDFTVTSKKENNPAIQAKEVEKPKFSLRRK